MHIPRILSILLLVIVSVAAAWLVATHPGGASTYAPAPPSLIAHRCGTADAPENTLTACRLALSYGVRKLWVSVQITRDGIPVLYRPRNLSALTDSTGDIADLPYAELAKLNAGWQFKETGTSGQVTYPYRNTPVHLPTLDELADLLPRDAELYIDIKTPDSARAAKAVAEILQRHSLWDRSWIYSTLADNLRAFDAYPQARLFETREQTRQRLVALAMEQHCPGAPRPGAHVGFELRREMEVTEPLTLGAGTSKVSALLWSSRAMECFKAARGINVTLFGINSETDYRLATRLGADAVMVDSPRAASAYRRQP